MDIRTQVAWNGAAGGMIGVAAFAAFTKANPMLGLFGGATFLAATVLTENLLKGFLYRNETEKTILFILSHLAGLVAAVLVTTCLGSSLTFATGFVLTAAEVLGSVALGYLLPKCAAHF